MIQADRATVEEYRKISSEFLKKIISKAESFIDDINELDNGTSSARYVLEKYRTWIKEIYRLYYELTEEIMPPDECIPMSDRLLELAGYVLDMAMILEQSDVNPVEFANRQWLVHNKIERYYQTLDYEW